MHTPDEIAMYTLDALDHYAAYCAPQSEARAMGAAARSYLAEADRAVRVVRALEMGIPAPRLQRIAIGLWAWSYAPVWLDALAGKPLIEFAPELTEEQAVRFRAWVERTHQDEVWPTLADAVLAAARAAGVE